MGNKHLSSLLGRVESTLRDFEQDVLGSIKEDVIKIQATAAPILEVLTTLEKHERRIKACF